MTNEEVIALLRGNPFTDDYVQKLLDKLFTLYNTDSCLKPSIENARIALLIAIKYNYINNDRAKFSRLREKCTEYFGNDTCYGTIVENNYVAWSWISGGLLEMFMNDILNSCTFMDVSSL